MAKISLGGTEEGLRAIGYIAQTFLAHCLPEIARLPELQAFKDYSQLAEILPENF
jgi:hypothetical protein